MAVALKVLPGDLNLMSIQALAGMTVIATEFCVLQEKGEKYALSCDSNAPQTHTHVFPMFRPYFHPSWRSFQELKKNDLESHLSRSAANQLWPPQSATPRSARLRQPVARSKWRELLKLRNVWKQVPTNHTLLASGKKTCLNGKL